MAPAIGLAVQYSPNPWDFWHGQSPVAAIISQVHEGGRVALVTQYATDFGTSESFGFYDVPFSPSAEPGTWQYVTQ